MTGSNSERRSSRRMSVRAAALIGLVLTVAASLALTDVGSARDGRRFHGLSLVE